MQLKMTFCKLDLAILDFPQMLKFEERPDKGVEKTL